MGRDCVIIFLKTEQAKTRSYIQNQEITVNFAKFLRTPFLQNTFGRLFRTTPLAPVKNRLEKRLKVFFNIF